MIKAEDLRIGDLVRIIRDCKYSKRTLCAVTGIPAMKGPDKIKVISLSAINDNDDSPWGTWCCNVEGIPLNPEILEKNGFSMREDTVVYVKTRLGLKPLGDGKGYQVGLGSLRFLFVKVRVIKYVHELQHILWALGLDANLKI
jgi:hypothetical protein